MIKIVFYYLLIALVFIDLILNRTGTVSHHQSTWNLQRFVNFISFIVVAIVVLIFTVKLLFCFLIDTTNMDYSVTVENKTVIMIRLGHWLFTTVYWSLTKDIIEITEFLLPQEYKNSFIFWRSPFTSSPLEAIVLLYLMKNLIQEKQDLIPDLLKGLKGNVFSNLYRKTPQYERARGYELIFFIIFILWVISKLEIMSLQSFGFVSFLLLIIHRFSFTKEYAYDKILGEEAIKYIKTDLFIKKFKYDEFLFSDFSFEKDCFKVGVDFTKEGEVEQGLIIISNTRTNPNQIIHKMHNYLIANELRNNKLNLIIRVDLIDNESMNMHILEGEYGPNNSNNNRS